MRPIPFPNYPKKLDARGRLKIKIRGKQYYLPKPLGSPASIAEYERLRLEHAQGSITSAPTISAALGLSISELIAAFIATDPRGLQDKELGAIARACVPLERLFGPTQASEFTSVRLRALQDAMASQSWMTDAERKACGTWSRRYCNVQAMRLLRVFKWAESVGEIPEGRYAHLRTVPMLKKSDRRTKDSPPRRPVDWQAQVVPALPFMSPQVAAICQLIYLIGARPGEVCAMRRDEITQGETPDDVWLFTPGKHKGTHRGTTLTKAIGPRAKTILLPWYLASEPTAYVFPPSKMRYRRGCYATEGLGRAISRACERAKVEPFTSYQLRHLAKQVATRECGLDSARSFLGQTSLGSTNQYAQGIDLELAARVAKRIG